MKIFGRFLIISIFVMLGTVNCARRGAPTGGPKDSIPPVMIKSDPVQSAINFNSKKIRIYFDEYVKLKDVNKQLVISPPAKTDPILTPMGTAGKFINIRILDTLEPNTTYSYNFGKSIVDNNEENELGNFKYVFSTGPYIDSLFIKGEVTDPTINEPTTEIDVMLYEYNEEFTDSVIYKEKPRYIASTLDSTLYDLSNLKEGKYLLIALKDNNDNKMFDPVSDKIGFVSDTISLPGDTIFNFSVFKEIPSLNVLRPKELNMGKLQFGYYGDIKDLEIDLTSVVPDGFDSFFYKDEATDTLNYWYTPFEADSLVFDIHKGEYFETYTLKPRSDEIDSLKVSQSHSGMLHMLDTFHLKTNTPINDFNKEGISVIKDSLPIEFEAYLSASRDRLFIDFEKEFDSEYNIAMIAGSFTDFFGLANDSLDAKVNTKLLEDYGALTFDIQSSQDIGFIVSLHNAKGELVRSEVMDGPGRVKFDLLDPSEYTLKLIYDENRNGIWDTGSFLDRRLPEKVRYFSEAIELRGNWDITEPPINADN